MKSKIILSLFLTILTLHVNAQLITGINRGFIAPGDYNSDSLTDLYLTGYHDDSLVSFIYTNKGNFYFLKNPNIKFHPLEQGAGCWFDCDNDGDLDFIESGQYYGNDTTFLYINNDSTFILDTLSGIHVSVIAPNAKIIRLDVNNDGYTDLLFVQNDQDQYDSKTFLLINNKNNSFSLDTVFDEALADTCDIDKNGLVDIITSSGLHFNNGNGTFSNIYLDLDSILMGHVLALKTITFQNDTANHLIILSQENDNDFDLQMYSFTSSTSSRMLIDQLTIFSSPNIFSLDVADLNNDSYPDIILQIGNQVFTYYYDSTYSYNNDPNSHYRKLDQFNDKLANYSNVYFALADLDNNGFKDFIFTATAYTQNDYPLCFIYKNIQGNFSKILTPIDNSIFSRIDNIKLLNRSDDMDQNYERALTADFDHNGTTDLLIWAPDSGFAFYSGDNKGHFKYIDTYIDTVSSKNSLIEAADYNKDSLPDLILFNKDSSEFIIYQNTGNWHFRKTKYIFGGVQYGTAHWIDVNNDSYPDLVFCGNFNNTDTALILMNNSGLSFTPVPCPNLITPNPSKLITINLNNDNYPDLILLTYDQNLQKNIAKFFVNTADTSFYPQFSIDSNFVNLLPYDYNFDGYDDLLAITEFDNDREFYQRTFLLKNNSGSSFALDNTIPLTQYAISNGSWVDFNGDGKKDLLISSLHKLGSAFSFFTQQYQNTGSSLVPVSTKQIPLLDPHFFPADFNNDGFEDLFCYGFYADNKLELHPENYIFFSNGSQFIQTVARIPQQATFFVAANFLRQTNPILITYYNNGLQSKLYSFKISKYGLSPDTISIPSIFPVIFDFNNDQYPDVFDMPFIYLNSKNGKFTSLQTNINSQSLLMATPIDFDNDGKTDILIKNVNSNSTSISIYKNQDNNLYETDFYFKNSDNVTPIDFNYDGKFDLVSVTHLGSIKLYQNIGNQQFKQSLTFPQLGTTFYNFIAADFLNQGNEQLLTVQKVVDQPPQIVLYKIFSDTVIKVFSQKFPEQFLPQKNLLMKLCDFNLDGKLDLFLPDIYSSNGEHSSIIVLNYLPDSLSYIYLPSLGYSDLLDIDQNGTLDYYTAFINGSLRLLSKIQTTNSNPPVPSNLSFSVKNDTVYLTWSKVFDKESGYGVTYNVYIYAQGGDTVVSPMSDLKSGKLLYRHMGNARYDTVFVITGLKTGVTYHWSVQAIDNSFNSSPFATDHIFKLPPQFIANPVDQKACEYGQIQFSVLTTQATDYQWQVDTGNGIFINLQNNDLYANVTTPTLFIKKVLLKMNNYKFRCAASNIGGTTYSNPATLTVVKFIKAFAGNDTTICSDTITLHADSPYPATGHWSCDLSSVTFSNPDSCITLVSGLPQSTVTLKWTVTQNNVCGSNSDVIVINRIASVDKPIAPSGPNKCVSGAAKYSTLKILNATKYQWAVYPDTFATVTWDNNNATVFWASNFHDTAYVKVRAGNICGYGPWSDSLQVVNLPAPIKPDKPTGKNYLCAGSNLVNYTTNSINPALSYQWSLTPENAGSVTGSNNTITISWNPAFSGTAQLKVRSVGCTESDWSDPLNIYVYASVPDKPATPAGPTDLCINNPNTSYSTLQLQNAQNYSWQIEETNAIDTLYQQGISATIAWNPKYFGLAHLKVRASNACGFGPWSNPLEINVKLPPSTPQAPIGDTSLCVGSAGKYFVQSVKYASNYVWNVFPDTIANIVNAGTQANINFSKYFSGFAYVKVKALNNCGESNWSDSLTVNLNSPIASPIKVKGQFMLICVDSGYNYQWYLNHKPILNATEQFYYHNPLDPGVYQVQITDSRKCSSFSPELVIQNSSKSANTKIQIIPNPSYSNKVITLNIQNNLTGKGVIYILNTSGEKLKQLKFIKHNRNFSVQIPLYHLAAGLYIIKVNLNQHSFTKYFVIY